MEEGGRGRRRERTREEEGGGEREEGTTICEVMIPEKESKRIVLT